MSKVKNEDNKSSYTLNSIKYEKDSIPFRIEFIKQLLSGKQLDPLIDFNGGDIESFTSRTRDGDDNSGESYDTRIVLKKRVYDFANIINQIGGRLEYKKSGTTGHTFKGAFMKDNDVCEYAVKVVAYPRKEKYGTIYDIRRPENAEIMMIKILSSLIVNKRTPHIVLPFGTFNTSITNFVNLIETNHVDKDEKKYIDFVDRYKKNEYYDQASILISEWANRGDLLDFIRQRYKKFNPMTWKAIFFQVLSVLAVIQAKYPSFRHNDMKANNLLVQKIDIRKKNSIYTVVNTGYVLPNIGYHVKLWDFDFACIPGLVDNVKVSSEWTKSINVTPEQNRYYDMHYFFNTLIKNGFFPQFMKDSCIPQEARDFVNRIVPDKYKEGKYVHKRGRILINEEYLTPDEVLKSDPYFEEFRRKFREHEARKGKRISEKKVTNTPDIKKFLKETPEIEQDNNDIINLLKGGRKNGTTKPSKSKSKQRQTRRGTNKRNDNKTSES